MGIAGSTVQIEVESLRIGMFVHLDGGWMSHPFPLSSFKIGSAEQIATIRSLGIKCVRWSPEHSEPEEPGIALQLTAHQPQASQPAAEIPAAESPESAARRQHREALAAERAALALCERQYAEATRECRRMTELVCSAPAVAHDKARSLTHSLVDKMLGAHDLCIRLLNAGAGDKASAHALNVSIIALLMGRCFGFSEGDMLDLGVGALLHDVGKLDLPARVRHRDDDFSLAECRFYEEHVQHGVAHAMKMGLSPGATLVVAQHHEHADGSGFPLHIGSDRMAPAASIVALVNRYDNLCNPQIPHKAYTPHEALSLLFAQGKNRFDTAILGAFIRMMGVYPPGSVVQLTDDRFGVVVGVNSSRPLKPRVQVHDPKVAADEAMTIDLEQARNLGIRRSIKPSALPRDALAYLSPRQRVAYYFEPAPEPVAA